MVDNRFKKSRRMLKRALNVTPVGSQTYSKSYRYLSGASTPYFIGHGRGSHVWDIDNNEFIDFILGLGSVTVGYNNPEINEAVRKQLEKGVIFSQANVLEVQVAEKLIEVIPCAEMVRFVKNGSDATTAAIRLSRAVTARDVIAVCGYHGMDDWYIGSTVLKRGIPKAVHELTESFEYNNISSLEKVFAKHAYKIAAVILEPIQANGPEDGFLEKVKLLCEKNGTVLIFDEIVSGFRVALGGAQQYYGVIPDLAAVGKGLANGLPLAAIVGKKEILKLVEDGVFISTTFGGETLSLAGALKTIEILERPHSFKHIWDLSTKLMKESESLMSGKKLDSVAKMWGLAPHSGFVFKSTDNLSEIDMLSVYQQRLLMEGILSVGINNFCLSHTHDDINRYLSAVDHGLDDLKKAVESDSVEGLLTADGMDPIFKRN